MRFLKLLLFRIMASFSAPIREEKVSREIRHEERQKSWRITLSDRRQEKLAAYIEWSKPENIAARMEKFKAEEAAAIEAGLKLKASIRQSQGLPLDDPPLPPVEELPKEMRGQAESTIRAMLRQKCWEYDRLLGKWHKIVE